MREKSPDEIYSISQDLVQGVIEIEGLPDLIIESADATFRGMPDIEADPPTRAIMARLQEAVDRLPILVEDGGATAASRSKPEGNGDAESRGHLS